MAVLAAALTTLLSTATAPATHLTATGSPGGPTVPWGFNEDWGWAPGQFSADLANRHMQKAGGIMPDSLSANRFHVQWADVERLRGKYDWTRTDRVYEAMQRHTALPVMLLYNAPAWARDPAATCPSANPCAYPPLAKNDHRWKQFVQAAVSRYRNVRAIEIWNEANIGRFWAPAADPTRYSTILRMAHEGAVAAKSTAPVLVGGLIPTGTNGTNVSASEFLRQVYANAGAAAFEGIASHPYPHQAPFVQTMWKRLDALRAVRDGRGDSATPLWITEVGVSTDPASGVPLDQQGDLLVELYRSIEAHDVNSFVIHRLHDIGSEGSYWNQTGVLYPDLTPKPAYCDLGALIGTPC
jgi:hypothetical protein